LIKTGSPVSTSRTWSRPGTHPDELRRHRAPGRHPVSVRSGAGWTERTDGTRSPCVLHTFCDRSAQAEVTFCRKAHDGRGPDAAGEIRVQVALGNQLEQPEAHRAVLDARGEPACGTCRSPDSAPVRSRPMLDGDRCNERNPS
jgi:hypothetical protein